MICLKSVEQIEKQKGGIQNVKIVVIFVVLGKNAGWIKYPLYDTLSSPCQLPKGVIGELKI